MTEKTVSKPFRKDLGTKGRQYTPEIVDAGLTVLAACNGNDRMAAKQLAEQGIKNPLTGKPIPRGTLQTWRRHTHIDRYLEIREKVLPRVKAEMAEKMERAALQGADLELKFMGRLDQEAADIETRDLGKTLQSVAVSTGINVQRSAELRGENQIEHVHVDLGATLSALQRLGVIESEATEVKDAELVEDNARG